MGGIDRDRVLVYMVIVGMMEMAVVQVVDVALVADRDMPAIRPMLVVVSLVDLVITHPGSAPSRARR
jgi:hypothetical protein